jgi:hypothetical protein
MTTHQRSSSGSLSHRKLLFAALCIFAATATGCGDPSRDVTNDFTYGNFSTVTGQWKTKQTLTLVQCGSVLYLSTTDTYHSAFDKPAKDLATLPPGTVVSVDHLILHPSFECDTFSRMGSLLSGPYAGKTLELDPELFALNEINTYYTGSPITGQLPRNWQVNSKQLEK